MLFLAIKTVIEQIMVTNVCPTRIYLSLAQYFKYDNQSKAAQMLLARLKKSGRKYAAKYLRLTLLSLVVAAVVTAVISAVGNPRQISVLPERLGPPLVGVFIQVLVVCFVGGLIIRLVSAHSADLKQAWNERIGGPLVDRWTGLARRTRAIITGVATAVVAGTAAAVAGVVYPVPLSLIGAVALFAWPVGTYWSLRRQSTAESANIGKSVVVRSRYADLRQQETRTVALLGGFLIAAATGTGLWLLGVDTAATAGIAGLVWLVATVIVYSRYETILTERTALAIVATTTTTESDGLELTIKNRGEETVDLTNPTLEDTTHERYRIERQFTLQPGGCATIQLPASFTWSSTTAERTLPLGYTLDRSQAAPIVYTQQGTAFELQHDGQTEENTAWAGSDETYTPEPTTVSNGAHSQD